MSYNILQSAHSDSAEIFTHLLGKEGEVVHHIFRLTLKVFAQFWVLCCHTHRTGVGVTLSHHHASQYYQWQCAEREFIGTQHCHDYHVLRRLQLSVGLQTHIVTQTVHHQRLLGLCQSYLW